jgi:hypothetical protein
LLNGCVRKVRIIVVPCCRIPNITFNPALWGDDPNVDNSLFEIYTAIPCTNYQNYIPNNGGYAQMDVEIQNPTWYRCRKYKITGTTLLEILGLRYYNCIDSIGGTSSLTSMPSLPTDGACIIDIVGNFNFGNNTPFIICATSFDNIPSNATLEEITDRYTNCCDCVNHSFTISPTATVGYIVIYQNCDGGTFNITRVPTNGSPQNFNICAKKGTVKIIKYTGSAETCTADAEFPNISITYGTSACNNCNDLFT